jgi:hypothetical protein
MIIEDVKKGADMWANNEYTFEYGIRSQKGG